MKIFFMSSKITNTFKGKYVLYFFLASLSLTLLTSQLVSHIKRVSEPAVSQTVAQSGFSVTIDVSGTLPQDGTMIMVNGEVYSPLRASSSVVELERSSVIEIFCEDDASFSVSVRPSVGTTVIMDGDKADCTKGMNYICRSFFAD